jgi:hypothetical protein
VIIHDCMNRTALIEQLKETQKLFKNCWSCLNPPSVTDSFPTFSNLAGNTGSYANDRAKEASRSSAASSAESLGFKGEFRQWAMRGFNEVLRAEVYG